jgi:predicted SAM-dependent methyltransferase
MKTYLNLGCGQRYHKAWTNIDFVSLSDDVQAHNLLQGIPFLDNTFEVVYHSHVLEHFSKQDGKKFISECYRVLDKNGILRVAVPDLEQIIREYLKNFELALQNDAVGIQNYEWTMLEMYDQVVRNTSGGAMAEYIFQKNIPNENYIFERIGEEGRDLRKAYLQQLEAPKVKQETIHKAKKDNRSLLRKLLSNIKSYLKNYLFQDEIRFYEELKKEAHYTELGKFRLGGEIHQWMYDRYSLTKLLKELGFKNIEIKTAFESSVPDWNSYELESKNKIVFKPDSLFIEAKK